MSKIDENAVEDIGLSRRLNGQDIGRESWGVGSSPTGSDAFRVFSSIFKSVRIRLIH